MSIIGLVSPRIAISLDDGLERAARLVADAAAAGAEVVCFPEAYLPGLRGLDFPVPPFDAAAEARAVEAVASLARSHRIGIIMGMEHVTPSGSQISAAVFGPDGAFIGRQCKCQLDPAEDAHYVPGTGRRLFEIGGLRFGIAICHEAFRYPETVRWAASRGAHVVFHPHLAGSDHAGPRLSAWGSPDAPYYERAVMCRALENTIYVASVNCATRYSESATAVIVPSGDCLAWLPYGEEGVLTCDIDPALATGLLARRFAPARYGEEA
jgi:predicted amidohydrolase